MRLASCAASVALLLCRMGATPGEAKDPWLGCWTRIYDADHLAKHDAQDVTAIGVSILARPAASGAPDKYLARVQLKVRYKPEVHANFSGAHCRPVGRRLHCLAKDVSEGNFWLKRSGKDLELLLTAAGEGVTVVPPSNPQGFVQILPQNPEHQLFLMPPAAPGACEL
jgi:hypothetical protein